METLTTTLTASYALVVTDGEDYVLQNTGGNDIEIIFDDTAPLDTAKGHILKPLDGASSLSWGYGDIYAKYRNTSGQVTVTK